jgi:uracil-DNA glycosylase
MSFEQKSPADSGRGFSFGDIREAKSAAESCKSCLVTIHPSAILRAQSEETRNLEFDRFVEDLREAASFLRV